MKLQAGGAIPPSGDDQLAAGGGQEKEIILRYLTLLIYVKTSTEKQFVIKILIVLLEKKE